MQVRQLTLGRSHMPPPPLNVIRNGRQGSRSAAAAIGSGGEVSSAAISDASLVSTGCSTCRQRSYIDVASPRWMDMHGCSGARVLFHFFTSHEDELPSFSSRSIQRQCYQPAAHVARDMRTAALIHNQANKTHKT